MHDTSMPLVTSGARRGCGYRQPGGAYFAVPFGPDGRPVEEFLIDPPILIDLARLGAASIGVTLIERDGVTHVLDIVGREHYPTVASFVVFCPRGIDSSASHGLLPSSACALDERDDGLFAT